MFTPSVLNIIADAHEDDVDKCWKRKFRVAQLPWKFSTISSTKEGSFGRINKCSRCQSKISSRLMSSISIFSYIYINIYILIHICYIYVYIIVIIIGSC